MTLEEFSKSCNLNLADLLEVLNWMKVLNQDNTDWVDSMYQNKIVKDLNDIIDIKQLKSQLREYKAILYDLIYSRASKNEFDLPKLYYKDKIKSNESLMRFIKTKF